jgi:O-antigen/teichoic acid export membrane protein
VLKAILYGIGGSVGSRIIIILSEILIARILGKEFYGQFAMINSNS